MNSTKKETSRIISILFSDLVGFSRLKTDELLGKARNLLDEFIGINLNDNNHLFHKTWGDALLICSDDPRDLIEIALNLRDFILNKNWKRIGFEKKLCIRIGIHLEKIKLFIDDEKVYDIAGKHVNLTARIEPIVPENTIYCTDKFYQLVFEDTEEFAKFLLVGKKKLAKNFGDQELYQINRYHEYTPVVNNTVSEYVNSEKHKVKIRKDFTEEEKEDYLETAYHNIKEYFINALENIEKQDSDIKTKVEAPDAQGFNVIVYVRGNRRAECQIWKNGDYMNGIYYSTQINRSRNSHN